MMKERIFVLIFVVCIHQARGGFERTEGGARVLCFGGAFVGLADDSWAMLYNPAGLAQLRFPEFSVFYSPQPFGLTELKSISLAAAYPTNIGSFGASLREFGFELYREFSSSVSYAREVEGIFAGMNLAYHSVSISNYGSAGTLGLDVGILVPILKTLRWGIAAKNVNAPTIGQSSERLPQTFTAGIFYQPLDALSLVFDYQKELGFPASPKFGFDYWIIDNVALRGGFADEPTTYAAGFGIRYLFFELDYAFTTHQELGLTHQASVTLRWLSKDE